MSPGGQFLVSLDTPGTPRNAYSGTTKPFARQTEYINREPHERDCPSDEGKAEE